MSREEQKQSGGQQHRTSSFSSRCRGGDAYLCSTCSRRVSWTPGGRAAISVPARRSSLSSGLAQAEVMSGGAGEAGSHGLVGERDPLPQVSNQRFRFC